MRSIHYFHLQNLISIEFKKSIKNSHKCSANIEYPPTTTTRKGEIDIVKIQFYISTNPFDLEGRHKKAAQMGKNSFQTAQKNATIMFYLVLFSLPFLVMWDKLVVVPTSKLFPRAIVNENDAGWW